MKNRHNVDNNIKSFYKMAKKGQIVFDSPIQRDDSQWNNVQKSKLIRAILIDFSIPPVYSVGIKNDDTNEMRYSILDGKQRLTSLIEYLDNQFQLSSNIPSISFEGEEYNIKGLKFDALPAELQEVIYDYSLQMVYYVHLSDEEIAEMFELLNNGTPLSRQQKANASMGMSSAALMNDLKKHPFMIHNACLSKNQRTRSEDAEVLTQAMMFVDPDYTLESFSRSNMNIYSAALKTGKDYIFKEMKDILDYAHNALDYYTDTLVLKKTVVPIILTIAKVAKDQGLEPELFSEWIQDFKLSIENRGKIKINYREYMGTGSFSKNKVQGRLAAAIRHYTVFSENSKKLVTA